MLLDVIKGAISVVSNIVGKEKGDKIKSALDVLNSVENDPEVQKAIQEHEYQMKKLVVQDAANARELIIAESKSEDAFVRRARPAFMWLFYIIIAFTFVIVPIAQLFKSGYTINYPVMPEELYWLFGTAFTGYGGFRSYDKRNKLKNGK